MGDVLKNAELEFGDAMVMLAGVFLGAEILNEPGALCWTELTTPDVPAAKSFYSDVLGWETDDERASSRGISTPSPRRWAA